MDSNLVSVYAIKQHNPYDWSVMEETEQMEISMHDIIVHRSIASQDIAVRTEQNDGHETLNLSIDGSDIISSSDEVELIAQLKCSGNNYFEG